MTRAFVLMTALPPTLGHLRLIQFAQQLAPTTVIVSTQPSEPYYFQRWAALSSAFDDNPNITVKHFHKEIEQNPEVPGFWEMWREIFRNYGFMSGDYIVASEPYGQRLAEELGGVFMPYDLHRTITPVKATPVRHRPIDLFTDMIPEFRKHFVSRVTIFGAESCGKTTLTRRLAESWKAPWLFEWARPYLEAVGADLTRDKMEAIHKGQLALQNSAVNLIDSPVVFQDTDLFSTWGYWDAHVELAPMPLKLVQDAVATHSDLYLITPSNIPFEQDPLRYGGTERELPDEYWINMCESNGLNYKVLTSSSRVGRVVEASEHVADLLHQRLNFRYERKFNE